VSAPKENKSVSADESGIRKQKQKNAKFIRLDDLIPKGNVLGGRLFGATDTQDTQQTTQNKKED
jgi:hypothetical protein